MVDLARHNPLLAEVSVRAAELNGEAVLALFREQPFRCEACEWSESPAEFASAVLEYTALKIRLHRTYRGDNYSERADQARELIRDRIWLMQQRLRPMRPCPDCTRNFNPTKRDKYGEPSLPSPFPPLEVLR